jgi:energy-coupling factor transporter ATP-binding protein EcfA2
MLNVLAVSGYRSLRELVIALDRLNLVTGPNGSGKSNLYRALRLLAETAQGAHSIAGARRRPGVDVVGGAGNDFARDGARRSAGAGGRSEKACQHPTAASVRW